jgi:hypothetical protein
MFAMLQRDLEGVCRVQKLAKKLLSGISRSQNSKTALLELPPDSVLVKFLSYLCPYFTVTNDTKHVLKPCFMPRQRIASVFYVA